MAIKTKAEILAALSNLIGENNDDASIAFMEDISDTYDDFETRLGDSTDWKGRYEENDREWRDKYKARFTEPTVTPPEPIKRETVERSYNFSELFSDDSK